MSAREQELEQKIDYLQDELDKVFARLRDVEDLIGLPEEDIQTCSEYMESAH